jgi:hypothetical protein
MSGENPGNNPELSDSNDLSKNSNIWIYKNPESESIEEITLVTENPREVPIQNKMVMVEEVPLFPITLESGEKYIPDLSLCTVNQTGEQAIQDPPIYSIDLGKYEEEVLDSVFKNGFDRSFLQFARDTLSLEDYARFIIEQEAVRKHLLKFNRSARPDHRITNDELIFYWEFYYPGNENYDSKLLPTTTKLFPLYLFNKLGYILNNREEFDLTNQKFYFEELDYLKSFIVSNYPNEPSEIFEKIRDRCQVDSRGIHHMMQYINTWHELFFLAHKKAQYLHTLNNIPRWRR